MTVPSKDDYPFRVVHEPGCGDDVVFLRVRPEPGSRLVSADAILPDGEPVAFESAVVCPSCGRFLTAMSIDQVLPR